MTQSYAYRSAGVAFGGGRTVFAQTMGYVAGTTALFALGAVLIFVHIPHGSLIYSILGLVIFAAFIMIDFQRLRRTSDSTSAQLLAASIFLDILNAFLFFLQLFGGRGND